MPEDVSELRRTVESMADVLSTRTTHGKRIAERLSFVASDGGLTETAALMELVARFIEKEG